MLAVRRLSNLRSGGHHLGYVSNQAQHASDGTRAAIPWGWCAQSRSQRPCLRALTSYLRASEILPKSQSCALHSLAAAATTRVVSHVAVRAHAHYHAFHRMCNWSCRRDRDGSSSAGRIGTAPRRGHVGTGAAALHAQSQDAGDIGAPAQQFQASPSGRYCISTICRPMHASSGIWPRLLWSPA